MGVAGFICPDRARLAVRRLKLRRALMDMQCLNTDALDRLDQTENDVAGAAATGVDGSPGLDASDAQCASGRESVDIGECRDVREQELLQGADLILQFLNSLLLALGHGAFSSKFNTSNANPAAPGAYTSK